MDEQSENGREAAAEAEGRDASGEVEADRPEAEGDAESVSADVDGEALEMTAPTLPTEMVLSEFHYWLQKLPGGRVAVKFAGVVNGPMGPSPFPPGYVVIFAEDGWEDFQKNVAEGRVRQRRAVQVAHEMPDGVKLPPGIRLPGR